MEDLNKGKVLNFRKGYPLFSPAVRASLEEGVKAHTESPVEVVNSFENILCAQLVTALRLLVSSIGTKAGEAFGKKISRSIN